LAADSTRKLVKYVWNIVLITREYYTNSTKKRLILECGGNSDDETPSVTAQRVKKHSVTLLNVLDSRRSFLFKCTPINAINTLATKSKRTIIIQTDIEKILDIAVTRNWCLPHGANHTAF
jgi:hypothetical protein